MKTGTEIKTVLKHINEDSKNKSDYLVDLKDLEVVTNHTNYPILKANHMDKKFHMTDKAINQLCGKLKIGRQYIQKCMPESVDLVAHNLNFWINRRDNRELMVRTFDHGHSNIDARAILTNRYKRIDCDVVANHCLDKLMDLDVEFKYSYYDGDRMNITAVTPKVEGEVVKGDVVQGGITITNSEVGNGSLMIKPFIYRLVCTNGMVAPQYFNQFYAKHVGAIVIDPTQDEQWKVTIEKMQKQLELVAKPEVFEENLKKLQDATKKSMNSHQIVQLAKRQGITDSERAGIFERLDRYVGDEFTVSKYELSNAITNMANDEEMSDKRARFFQELGGLVVFANNPMQIAI